MSGVPATLLVCGAPKKLKQAVNSDNHADIHAALEKHVPKVGDGRPALSCEGSFTPNLWCRNCPLLLAADATYEPGPLDHIELDSDLEWNHSVKWGDPITVEATSD